MEKTFRFGIIGVGSRGIQCWCKDLMARENVEIVAFCDTNAVRLDLAAEFLGRPVNKYSSAEELLKSEKLDAVVITTPDCFHEQHAVAALNAGVNVFLEKPLATSVAGCKNVLKASHDNGKEIMIGFNLRHNAVLKKMKELITQGMIGRVFMLENREFYDGGRTYMARWNGHYDISKGLWIHKGCHDFDITQWLMDFPKPVRVNSFAGLSVLTPDNYPFKLKAGVQPGPTCHVCAYKDVCKDVFPLSADGDVRAWGDRAAQEDGYHRDMCMYQSDMSCHDNGIAMIEYDNGARAVHSQCFVTPFSDRRYTIMGTLGIMEASLTERVVTVRPRWSNDVYTYKVSDERGGHGGADPHIMDTFIGVLKGEVVNTSLPEHGMMSTAVGQAAEMSRREGRIVQIKELFA